MTRSKQWGWNANGWDTSTAKKQKEKGKGKGPQADMASFPTYDASGSSGSSQPTTDAMEGNLKQTLAQLFAKKEVEMPKELEPFFKPQIGEALQTDQKKLNAKRKMVAKLDRLNKAVTRKQEQWHQFKAAMKDHLITEQARFDNEIAEINTAIQETQISLDKMLSGEEDPMQVEEEKKDTPLEEMLGTSGAIPTGGQTPPMTNMETMEELRKAHQGQMHLAQQVQDLQQQLLFMTNMMKTPMTNSPMRDTLMQPPFTPVKTRANVGPAATTGPYAKVDAKMEPKKDPPANGQETINVEELSD